MGISLQSPTSPTVVLKLRTPNRFNARVGSVVVYG